MGLKHSQADVLIDFLRHNHADTIYLVGDIIDLWYLSRNFVWPKTHTRVLRMLMRKVREGTRVVYIPGNHDSFFRQFVGMSFGGIEIKRNACHDSFDGRRYFILHGDEFDVVLRNSKWLAYVGDILYDTALSLNYYLNYVRGWFGRPYWSFSAWAKFQVKSAVSYVGSFEEELAYEAHRRGADGVICGHIHHSVIREVLGITYVNTGDFVESCSYVVERDDGKLISMVWLKNRGPKAPSSRLRSCC